MPERALKYAKYLRRRGFRAPDSCPNVMLYARAVTTSGRRRRAPVRAGARARNPIETRCK